MIWVTVTPRVAGLRPSVIIRFSVFRRYVTNVNKRDCDGDGRPQLLVVGSRAFNVVIDRSR
jgi:hypothetical protein